jgi:type VI secretion system protein VasI
MSIFTPSTARVLALVIAGSFFATSAISEDVSHCVDISDPNDRLNCFDAGFVTVEQAPPAEDSAWNISIETSNLDDSTLVIMTLDSSEQLRGPYGQSSRGRLILRCKENTTSAQVYFGDYFMSDLQGRGRVDYRIDSEQPRRVDMRVSTNNKYLGLWNGGTSIPFIQRMLAADELLVRATPFSDSPIEMKFAISGLEDQITPLREACSW